MNTVSIDAPKVDAGHVETADNRVEPDGQFLMAVKLFEMGRVTTAQAAGMCGMESVDFILAAQRANQPRTFTAT
jgi:hypothetical protein